MAMLRGIETQLAPYITLEQACESGRALRYAIHEKLDTSLSKIEHKPCFSGNERDQALRFLRF
jgi:hypothetical protein